MRVLLLILATVLVAQLNAQFRNTTWGMTPAEVKAADPQKFDLNDAKTLAYQSKLGDSDVGIYYLFEDGKLAKGIYVYMDEHSNENLYIDDFHRVNEIIENKYGALDDNTVNWSNDLYKEDKNYYGTSLSLGYHSYLAHKLSIEHNLGISHVLSGDNFKVKHMLIYADPASLKKEAAKEIDGY